MTVGGLHKMCRETRLSALPGGVVTSPLCARAGAPMADEEASAASAAISLDRTTYKAPLVEGELPPSLYSLHHIFGFDSHRRYNLEYFEQVRSRARARPA